jgi:hypothetical protein
MIPCSRSRLRGSKTDSDTDLSPWSVTAGHVGGSGRSDRYGIVDIDRRLQ